MHTNYIGVLIDHAARGVVHNDLYLSVYVTMLANQTTTRNPSAYLSSIKEGVKHRFGPHLNVAYFDRDLEDVIVDIQQGDAFHLKIFATTSYYSCKRH